MRVSYLNGERVALRPLVPEDKAVATAWHPSPYPIDAVRAETWLKENHKDIWPRRVYYALVRASGAATAETTDDEVVGLVRIGWNVQQATARFTMAPWLEDADSLRADAIGTVLPWLLEEREMLVVTFILASDEAESIAAAEAAGMAEMARLREHVARPGGRADLLYFQKLNRPWRFDDEEDIDA